MKTTAILFLLSLSFISCIDKRQQTGEDIYLKVIHYKNTHGRLPDSLNDIGVEGKMEGPIYYKKQTDSTFIIYYGGGLGESVIYDHKTGKWKSDRQ